ncbi:hypothetical protein Tco_0742758 [Tanacetum coccineum]
MMYNWIMRRKLDPREDANGGISNFTGRIKVMHVFVGNFTYVIDFMILEDISLIIDPRLSQLVLGRPFIEISNMTYDPPEGLVRFINGADEVAYKMPHKIEQYESLSNLEKEHTKSVYLRNEEDKRRGVEYVMSKILGFYKECLELGPKYLTGMDDEGEVTYFSFGRHLDELHVTWAYLEKKRARLRTITKTLENLCSQSLETTSQAIHDAVTTHQNCGFLDSGGRKNNHRKKANTVTGTVLVMKLNRIMNDATLLIAVKEVVSSSIVDETVAKEKPSSLVEKTGLKSYPPLPMQETTTTGNTLGKSSYGNVTGKPSRKKVNFHTLFTPGGNGIDVVVPLESVRAISERFANIEYGFLLGKRVAYHVVVNYVRNT